MNRRNIILVFIILLFLSAGFAIYSFFLRTPKINKNQELNNNQAKIEKQHQCLKENEFANFIPDSYGTSKLSATIIVKDRGTQKEEFSFQIDNISSGTNLLEIHKCGVYAMRGFGFDPQKSFYTKYEFWKYNYQGDGEMLMSSDKLRSYSLSFRIDETETYIALEKGWVGDPNYALVIKNLKTMEDVFEIKLTDLVEKYGIEPGIFTMPLGWDEKRFGFQIHAGEIPVFIIEKETWNIEKVF